MVTISESILFTWKNLWGFNTSLSHSLTYRVPIYTTSHTHVHLYVCAGQRSDWWNFAFFDVTVSLHSPLQPLGFLNKSDGFVCMLAGFRSILPQNQEFSPRMFWWKRNNIFNINNSDSDDSRCVLLTDEQMSHQCALQLLQNPPTASQLIQMFCKASYC